MKLRFTANIAAIGLLIATLTATAQTPHEPGTVADPQPTSPRDVTQPATGGTMTAGGTFESVEPEEPGINFVNQPLQVVVSTLALQAKMRIIIPDEMAGNITVRLRDVEPKDALKSVLESKGYVLVEGSSEIYTIQKKEAESLEVVTYTLNYIDLKEVAPAVTAALTPRGKLQFTGTTLIIYDVPSNLDKVLKLIKQLDTQTPQVLIETRLYEVVRNPKKELGLDWTSTLGGGETGASGLQTVFGGAGGSAWSFPVGVGGTMPSSALLTVNQFNVVLRYLNTDKNAELIATPRVVTTDSRQATIKIVRQEPIPQFQFNTRTASFEISGFEYKDIGNTLKVTPHVNKDNFITLDVDPEVSTSSESRDFGGTPGTSTGGGGGGGGGGTATTGGSSGGSGLVAKIPVISTRTLSTRVVLRSGDTLAIGGLIQTEKSNTYTKVPVAGDIPVLGAFFRSRSLATIKRNLVIFITPTMIPPGGKTGMEDQADGLQQEEVYTEDTWMPKDNARPQNRMPKAKSK